MIKPETVDIVHAVMLTILFYMNMRTEVRLSRIDRMKKEKGMG
jgi:hypothetical protein